MFVEMSNKDYIYADIIEDSEDEDNSFEMEVSVPIKPKRVIKKNNVNIEPGENSGEQEKTSEENPVVVTKPRAKTVALPLRKYMHEDSCIAEIGVDEAGRGPLFGRVYAAAAILPKDDSFDHSKAKDSKKFHSKKKIEEVAEYIKTNALAWAVAFEDEQTIDEINILQATQQAMHKAILAAKKDYCNKQLKLGIGSVNIHLLIDGNYFKPITNYNNEKKKIETLPFTCVEGGDNKFSSIAAASILAKVERDNYIDDLCAKNPELAERYSIDSNKGYGAKKHLDGIKEYGISIWHRKTFGICKEYC
jgi:ribonuclease HII